MNGVQELEEGSGPTHQDNEQGVTAAATIIASTPLQLLPSHPPSETSITQTSEQDTHPIESDPVPATSREEKSEETITTSNARAHDHYPYHRADHEAPTTEHISHGAREEIAPNLEASFSPEVYRSLYSIHHFDTDIQTRYGTRQNFHSITSFIFLLYVNFTCSNVL